LSLSKAAGIQLTFRAGNQVLQSNYLKPIEPNQPFRTYVSLTRPAEFYRFFASEPVPARAWDSIRYSSIEPDWLGVAPKRVEIQWARPGARNFSCLEARSGVAVVEGPFRNFSQGF